MMYDGPSIVDEVNPTQNEIRAWAYSDAVEPMQDWDIIIAELANLGLLMELVGDTGCPSRLYLLGALYCLVGHSDHADAGIMTAAASAESSENVWLSAWGRRVQHVLAHPSDFKRDDWCGWPGYRAEPEG